MTSFPAWIYSTLRLYALSMESPNSTHHGLIITRSAQWSKETCRIIAKHFLLPFRIALSVDKPLGVLPLLQSQLESSLQPILARNLQGTRLGTVCHTTHLGYFQSPVPYYLFFMFMWQKVPNPIPCGKATFASASSCYSTFFFLFRGGSLKCSHIWQISIITPRTRSCCASIFVIYSWWYCTKYIRLPFHTPSEDSVFFLFLFLLRCRSLLPIQLLIRQCYLTAAKVRPTCPVVLSSFSRDSPPKKNNHSTHFSVGGNDCRYWHPVGWEEETQAELHGEKVYKTKL